jgi:hypothetical protein
VADAAPKQRIFVLSPARLDGERAKLLFNPHGQSQVATALRTREGIAIGEVFRFVSGLYFRGKLAYATKFARPPAGSWVGSGALVITANRGIIPGETRVCLEQLEAFAETNIDHRERNFRAPLERDAIELAKTAGAATDIVLLGSIASKKYVEPLLNVFGEQLLFPAEFVGRGDMSRGGLLLRATEAGQELNYIPVKGAVRHGARPPKLPKKSA